MKTRQEAITAIAAEVVAICDIPDGYNESRLNAMVGHYYDLAATYTCFSVLPDALLPSVCTACVRAWRRRGSEANVSFTGIGVSERYINIEQSLKDELKMMKNPCSPVIMPKEEASDSGDESDDEESGGDEPEDVGSDGESEDDNAG